jgi:hypothetical protein
MSDRQRYLVGEDVLHGLQNSVGGVGDLQNCHPKALKQLVKRVHSGHDHRAVLVSLRDLQVLGHHCAQHGLQG